MKRFVVEQLLKIFWIFPIKKNRLVFRSAQGEKYNCNPKYICEYMINEYGDKYQYIWLFDNPQKYKYLKNKNIVACNQKSVKGLYYAITAKFLIDNHGVQSYLPIRKKQEIVNTWHGGGSYKKPYVNRSKSHVKYINKMNNRTTLFLSSCNKFSKYNLSRIETTLPEKIMCSGMPRNDIFFSDNEISRAKVKEALKIKPNEKIILYAPTFRDNLSLEDYYLDIEKIVNACKKRFGGEFVFAIRLHHFIEKKLDTSKVYKNAVNTNFYEDMQQLILASDVIISDYSSCIWDVSLAKKPCFIYATDLNEYIEDRGFYTPILEWPFPLAKNVDELLNNILKFDIEKYMQDTNQHHKDLGSYENGTACKQVAKYIEEIFE